MAVVLLGNRGRDVALAERLEGHRLHVIGQYENPTLYDLAETSGGQFHTIGSITDVQTIADLVQAIEPDMFITNFDDSLAAGVVDAIRQRVTDGRMKDLLIPCPDKAASQIEWDKFFLREIINEINPKYNPENFMATTPEQAFEAIAYFRSVGLYIVIKPRNLSGGKGVKVMGPHLRPWFLDDPNDTRPSAEEYALAVLARDDQTGIEIQEKLQGHEFTLQILTDGKIMVKPPATYDYPYREDGDTGPGTGGMGSFTMPAGEQLPFMADADYSEAMDLMAKVLEKLRERGIGYKGVLYPTFFKTPNGLKIVEINARGGEPELINILDLMEDGTDVYGTMRQIAKGELTTDSIRYQDMASALMFLVAPQYAYSPEGPNYDFELNFPLIHLQGCKVRFAATRRTGEDKGRLQSIGPRRVFGLSAQGKQPWDAQAKILTAIKYGFQNGRPPFQYRKDVASKAYIEKLST